MIPSFRLDGLDNYPRNVTPFFVVLLEQLLYLGQTSPVLLLVLLDVLLERVLQSIPLIEKRHALTHILANHVPCNAGSSRSANP